MSAEVDLPDEVVESSASGSKTTKISLVTNPLAGDSLLQMTPPLPTLPFEMITEILCKLQVKSLMKFKCVCKIFGLWLTMDPCWLLTINPCQNDYYPLVSRSSNFAMLGEP